MFCTRRFQKSFYIQLPTEIDRQRLFETVIRKLPNTIGSDWIRRFASSTKNFTGRDIVNVVRQAYTYDTSKDMQKDLTVNMNIPKLEVVRS
jgi:SpoVK/Ycf46/Vps4 family AAA+-type ATPase